MVTHAKPDQLVWFEGFTIVHHFKFQCK